MDTDQQICTFMNIYDLSNLVQEPTCFKSDNPRCIDLILTNRCRSFQHTTTTETGLSDFHKMIVAVLITTYQKTGPTVVNYIDYNDFSEPKFMRELKVFMHRKKVFLFLQQIKAQLYIKMNDANRSVIS